MLKIAKILTCFMVFLSHEQADIISLKSMKHIQKIIHNISEKDLLIVFDVDMTITQPNHPATFYPSLIMYKKIYKTILDDLTAEQRDIMLSLTLDQPQILVENNTPTIIAELQKKYKTIAFTALLTKKDKVKRRIKILEDFGIKFKNHTEDMSFIHMKNQYGQYPIFTRGILFGNGEIHGKGTLLCAFLRKLKSLPKMVIVVDDRKKHLEDMKKKLSIQKIPIDFLGIEYKGAFKRSKNITKKEFKKFWTNLAHKSKSQICEY
jgi:hypothetical protein